MVYLNHMRDIYGRNFIIPRFSLDRLSVDDIKNIVNSPQFETDPLLQRYLQDYILSNDVYPSQWHW